MRCTLLSEDVPPIELVGYKIHALTAMKPIEFIYRYEHHEIIIWARSFASGFLKPLGRELKIESEPETLGKWKKVKNKINEKQGVCTPRMRGECRSFLNRRKHFQFVQTHPPSCEINAVRCTSIALSRIFHFKAWVQKERRETGVEKGENMYTFLPQLPSKLQGL